MSVATADEAPYPSPGALGLYREIWRYAAGRRGTIILAYSLLLLSQVLKLPLPYLWLRPLMKFRWRNRTI